jgi:hypothetical protein
MISSWPQLSDSFAYQREQYLDVLTRQEKWLMNCLGRNRYSMFGRHHQFDQIQSIDDYRSRVPLCCYEDLSDSMEQIEQGQADILFAGQPLAFERTSGSRDAAKLVPYTPELLQDFRQAILPWLAQMTRQYQITNGSAYWAISPATRQPETTSGGVPVGIPDVAYLGEDIIPFFEKVSAVPHWVGGLRDIHDWQLATLYYLVSCDDLVLISVWSPTFLLSILETLDKRKMELVKVLSEGFQINEHWLPPNLTALQRLEQYFNTNDMNVLWPNLKVISCWADASSKPFYQQLGERFPEVDIQPKGLLLTEGVVSVPNEKKQSVLTADSGFYEFLDSQLNSKLAHELVEGQCYEVVMTTSAGLYRYRTFDKVVCNGYADGLPILHFNGRANFTSDLVGEKLTDEFVIDCLAGLPGFRMIVPVDEEKPGYQLVLDQRQHQNLESLVEQVERRLLANPHYAYARTIGQLQPLKPLAVENPLDIYLNSPLHAGTRLGDIKVPSLCLKSGIFNSTVGAAA